MYKCGQFSITDKCWGREKKRGKSNPSLCQNIKHCILPFQNQLPWFRAFRHPSLMPKESEQELSSTCQKKRKKNPSGNKQLNLASDRVKNKQSSFYKISQYIIFQFPSFSFLASCSCGGTGQALLVLPKPLPSSFHSFLCIKLLQ